MNFFRTAYLFICLSVFWSSCNKHESIVFNSHSIPITDEITSVYFRDKQNGIAVGGDTWTRGIVCRTNDGGKNWNVEKVFDKELFCTSHTSNGLLVAMGIELNLYELRDPETIIHSIKHTGSFKFIRGVSAYDSNTIMAVHTLGIGSIEKFNLHSDSTHTVLSIDHELNAIQYIDSSQWIACGYGIVLRSNDTGEHWDTLDVTGDQFLDISFLAPSTIYILGVGGSIYKSDNKGISFNSIKSGGIVGNSPPFKCICFKNNQEGLIAGEEGLVMLTRDGGSNWSIVDGLPTFDVKHIYFDGDEYWLCGTHGTIISIRL